jgi:pimeloyl-ACP methyl ester carboxylesterase
MDAPLLTVKDAIELSNGRTLSYAAAGRPGGVPVLYFHGAIGSPPADPELGFAIERFGIRYLMVDRPGFNGSDPQPGRRVVDFSADVGELATRLGLHRFSILGVSAGAPYGLACAAAMPDRVAAVAAVSTIPPCFSPRRSRPTAPIYRLPLMLLRRYPQTIQSAADSALTMLRRRPVALRRLFSLGAAAGDRDLLRSSEAREVGVRRFLGATARGSWPMIEEFLVCCSDWGFELSQVTPTVYLWHGLRDPIIPIEHADAVRRELPHVWARFVEAGHFLLRPRIADILRPLAAALAEPQHTGRADRLAA